jgi:hypothetical protein
MVKMRKEDVLIFTDVEDKGIFPGQQMHFSYYIDERMLINRHIVIKPLTLSFLLSSSIKNNCITAYWIICRMLYKAGFIDIPEAAQFRWKYFRITFWKDRKYK